MGDDADGHQLFTVVAAVHHQRVGEALDYGTLGFAESFHGVAASGMGDINWGADLYVIAAYRKIS